MKLKSTWQFLIPLFLVLFFLSLLSQKTFRAPWYEQWVWNVISPVTSILSWAVRQKQKIWGHYVYLVHTSKENEHLQKEVNILRQQIVTFEEVVAENQRLIRLLELKETQWPDSLTARVIAFDPKTEFKSLRIDKGLADGLTPDMPVIAHEGLVGRIGPVFSHDSLVLLIVDPGSSVDCLVERSRVRGLLVGKVKDTELRPGYFLTKLEYLKQVSDIEAGDVVMTSGMDQLFPKGIAVGVVETVQRSRFGIFLDAEVVPMVDFARLEEVMVLKK